MSFNQKRRLKNPNPFVSAHAAGSLVRSTTGRSRGREFTVTAVFTDKHGRLFAAVADGKKYTALEPKIKSAAHLETLKTAEQMREQPENQ